MEVGDWITLAAVLVALGLGLYSLIQTHNLQKRERKERLLNEIIEWAVGILKLDSDLFSFTESVRLRFTINLVPSQTPDKLYSDTVSLRDKGRYIKRVANIAGDKTNDAAAKIHNELNDIANLLDKFSAVINLSEEEDALKLVTTEDEMAEDKNKNQDTIEKHRKKLSPLCNLIIKEIANIKTRGTA
jgi:hypothetical protein